MARILGLPRLVMMSSAVPGPCRNARVARAGPLLGAARAGGVAHPFKGGEAFSVGFGESKARLDAFLSEQLPAVTRSRIQNAIKGGGVEVNGAAVSKPSFSVGPGDKVICRIPGPAPLAAEPEDIPLEIAYEDEQVLVVNKPPHLVVHPAPGHPGGTLVNAVLYHCGLPAMRYAAGSAPPVALNPSRGGDAESDDAGGEAGDEEDEDGGGQVLEGTASGGVGGVGSGGAAPLIRPGIVHRLDKGTSGLLVVAKEEAAHAHLCDQFKAHTVRRRYVAITLGVPEPSSGRVETHLGRDLKDRKKMAAFPMGSLKGRWAASNYRVLEVLAGGGAALVEWRLETGRTHQIRVHAKHVGHPILGDDTYGGAGGAVAEWLGRGLDAPGAGRARAAAARAERPMLHARMLGFVHPASGEQLEWSAEIPGDMAGVLGVLRELANE